MKTIIHVNQHNIKANLKGSDKPVITCKTYKSNNYANNVNILDENGKVVATIKYSPNNPLSCGAKVWIETKNEIQIIN
jgi:flagellar hook assembly protein FlgD